MTETSFCHSVCTTYDEATSFKHAYESIGKYLRNVFKNNFNFKKNFNKGRGIPFSESKIINPETNEIVLLNADGELCIRGPHIIKEYWDEKKKTQEAIDKNGW